MENESRKKRFVELLKEAGFVVVDGDVDYSFNYTKDNLDVFIELMTKKVDEYVDEALKVIYQIEEHTDKESEEYAELSAKAAEIDEKRERIRFYGEKIRKELQF